MPAWCALALVTSLAQPALLDRTLALVGGQAITLSDVRAAIALGLVDMPAGPEPIAAATTALVDRALVLREVQRYAPPAPTESEVDARMDETRRRLAAGAALATVLRSHGLSETRLRAWLRDDVPDFAPGDTLKVHVRVVEGTRERVQLFQGAVIRRQGSGARETFTVRKVSFGVGVERTFPVHSPILAKIEVVTRGDVRRAKLYYLRDRIGKAAKIKEKRV